MSRKMGSMGGSGEDGEEYRGSRTPIGVDGGKRDGMGAREEKGSGERSSKSRHEGVERLAQAAEESMRVCAQVRAVVTSLEGLPSDVQEELRHLSLSLAALDRALSSYIREVLQTAGMSFGRLHVDGGLREAVELLRSAPPSVHRLLPPGGLTSLLFHLTSVLEDLGELLQDMGRSGTPWRRALRWGYPLAVLGLLITVHSRLNTTRPSSTPSLSSSSFSTSSSTSTSTSSSPPALLFPSAPWLPRAVARPLWSAILSSSAASVPRGAGVQGGIGQLRRRRLERRQRGWVGWLDALWSKVLEKLGSGVPATVALGLLSVLLYRLWWERVGYAARLRRMARQLDLLLRIWIVASALVLRSMERQRRSRLRNPSYALLIDDPHRLHRTSIRKSSSLGLNLRGEGQRSMSGKEEGEDGSGGVDGEEGRDGLEEMLELTSLPRGAAIWSTRSTALAGVKFVLDVTYSSTHVAWEVRQAGLGSIVAQLAGFSAMLWYALVPGAAEHRSAVILHERVDVAFVKSVWANLDSVLAKLVAALYTAGMPLAVSRKEHPSDGKGGVVPCFIFSANDLPPGILETPCHSEPRPESALMYIHGGGFIGGAFAIDFTFLAGWAARGHGPIVYPFYSLSPEARFPQALEQCIAVYRCLRKRFRHVTVFGESAGGNIAAALCLALPKVSLPPPDRLVLCFPALNLNPLPSPSRALHLNDPLIPARLLKHLAAAYAPRPEDPHSRFYAPKYAHKPFRNPLMSPAVATDTELESLPPTRILVGGLDPLLDDAVDFATRLDRVHKLERLVVFRSLPHGFLAFWMLEPAAVEAVKTLERWCTSPPDST